MSQSLSKIYVHLIFSTRGRKPFIPTEIQHELFSYMAKALNTLGCTVVQIGGMNDHMHILCILNKTTSTSDLVKKIKTDTSKWIKTKSSVPNDFHWQSGYAAFSVSQSDIEKVAAYIRDQPKHHEKISFKDELRKMLKRYKVNFDEKQIWD